MASYSIARYHMDGTLGTPEEFSGAPFERAAKGNAGAVLHQVVVAMQANARVAIAHTKYRGEVRGGGKKPWKQKGTGRARQGSIRSPQWRGGGVVFGPRSNRNFTQKINDKMKHKAFLIALKEHFENKSIAVLEAPDDTAKTKVMAGALKKIRTDWRAPRQSFLFLCSKSSDGTVRRATRNIINTTVQDVADVSVMDVMKHSYVVATPTALETLKTRISK